MGGRSLVLVIGLAACSSKDKSSHEPPPAPKAAPATAAPIKLTQRAATKIREIRVAENTGDNVLRVEVRSTRAAPGFEYNLYFDGAPKPGDKTFVVDGIPLMLDATSLSFLDGAEIDFVEGPKGAGFKFKNPNAKGVDDSAPDGPPTFGDLQR
jgi:iron-sulfur cluster insertion protein